MEYFDELLFLDQHAAHERLQFDKLILAIKNGEVISQNLLSPILIELDTEMIDALEKHKEELFRIGYHIEEFGENSYQIISMPTIIDNSKIEDTLKELLKNIYQSGNSGIEEVITKLIATKACRSSIMAGDKLTKEEILYLLEKLFNDSQNHTLTCPHGRPIIAKLNKDNIAKMFRRT